MGNVHSLKNRLTALSMACLSSAGLILCALSGFSCSYVSIVAQPQRNIMTPNGQEFVGIPEVDIGVLCDSPFLVEWDRMWNLSQIFFWVSLGLGGVTALMAWALSMCMAPNQCSWRTMSLMAAATAVMEVPIFLIFESEPCNMDISRQTCSLSMGAYFNIASVVLWVAMTLWTQLLDAPDWSTESDAWKSPVREISIPASETSTGDCSPERAADEDGGNLLVTSTENSGMAIWTAGNKGEEKGGQENMSEISSISETDVESGRVRDLEPNPVAKRSSSLSPIREADMKIISIEPIPESDAPAENTPKPQSSGQANDTDGNKSPSDARYWLTRAMSPVEEKIRSIVSDQRRREETEKANAEHVIINAPTTQYQRQPKTWKKVDDTSECVYSPTRGGPTESIGCRDSLDDRWIFDASRSGDRTFGDEMTINTDDMTGCRVSITLPDGTKRVTKLPDCLVATACGVLGEGDDFSLRRTRKVPLESLASVTDNTGSYTRNTGSLLTNDQGSLVTRDAARDLSCPRSFEEQVLNAGEILDRMATDFVTPPELGAVPPSTRGASEPGKAKPPMDPEDVFAGVDDEA